MTTPPDQQQPAPTPASPQPDSSSTTSPSSTITTTTAAAAAAAAATPSPRKHKFTLTGAPETLLIPLAARAQDFTSTHPILHDRFAGPTISRLDYDFSKVHLSPDASASIAVRTAHFDRLTAAFLAAHREEAVTVLHLGCGLDGRALRLEGEWMGVGEGLVRWVDVDLEEVVAVRREVFVGLGEGLLEEEEGRRGEYRLLGADITEEGWLNEVPADRPTVVVMEGLISYLDTGDRDRLLERLLDRFPEGEILTDCISSMLLKGMQASKRKEVEVVRRTGAVFQSVVDDPKHLETIGRGMKLEEVVRYFEVQGLEKLPLLARVTAYICSWIPGIKDNVRFLRFIFGP